MNYNDFIANYNAMIEEEGYSEEKNYCEGCPCRERCKAEELFWGCQVWEDSMGEDL